MAGECMKKAGVCVTVRMTQGRGGGVRTVISIVWLMGEGRGIIREEAKEI